MKANAIGGLMGSVFAVACMCCSSVPDENDARRAFLDHASSVGWHITDRHDGQQWNEKHEDVEVESISVLGIDVSSGIATVDLAVYGQASAKEIARSRTGIVARGAWSLRRKGTRWSVTDASGPIEAQVNPDAAPYAAFGACARVFLPTDFVPEWTEAMMRECMVAAGPGCSSTAYWEPEEETRARVRECLDGTCGTGGMDEVSLGSRCLGEQGLPDDLPPSSAIRELWIATELAWRRMQKIAAEISRDEVISSEDDRKQASSWMKWGGRGMRAVLDGEKLDPAKLGYPEKSQQEAWMPDMVGKRCKFEEIGKMPLRCKEKGSDAGSFPHVKAGRVVGSDAAPEGPCRDLATRHASRGQARPDVEVAGRLTLTDVPATFCRSGFTALLLDDPALGACAHKALEPAWVYRSGWIPRGEVDVGMRLTEERLEATITASSLDPTADRCLLEALLDMQDLATLASSAPDGFLAFTLVFGAPGEEPDMRIFRRDLRGVFEGAVALEAPVTLSRELR